MALWPVAVVFFLGGLIVAAPGIRQLRLGMGAVCRVGSPGAVSLESLVPGTAVLASGTITGPNSALVCGFLVADEYGYQVISRQGPTWNLSRAYRPSFQLMQPDGTLLVLGQNASIVRSPHKWEQGTRRLEGFQPGDHASVIGVVGAEGGQVSVGAELVSGGDEGALLRYLEQQGVIRLIIGLLCFLFGALFTGIVGPLHTDPSTVRYQSWRRRR
jgi:hypothetical protein